MPDRQAGPRVGRTGGRVPPRLAALLARLGPTDGRDCLAACCALAAGALAGADPGEARPALERALAAAPGGPVFANARVALARLCRLRSEVVSGPLAALLPLGGLRGLLLLGVNPRLLYPGAAPARHAVLVASASVGSLSPRAAGDAGRPDLSGSLSPRAAGGEGRGEGGAETPGLPVWASGLLSPLPPGAGTVDLVDPSLPDPFRQGLRLDLLAASFDAAGREGLLILPRAEP
jgi:hypothetical protein